MLLFTATFGGLLLMMGNHSPSESLFHYFRLEDQVPEDHLLRLIDRHVDFDFVRAKLKDRYSDTGRLTPIHSRVGLRCNECVLGPAQAKFLGM
jgi:hypothetical protein